MRKHTYTIFQCKHNKRAILMKSGIFPRVGTMFPYFPVAAGATLETVGSNAPPPALNPSNPWLHTKLKWISRGGMYPKAPLPQDQFFFPFSTSHHHIFSKFDSFPTFLILGTSLDGVKSSWHQAPILRSRATNINTQLSRESEDPAVDVPTTTSLHGRMEELLPLLLFADEGSMEAFCSTIHS